MAEPAIARIRLSLFSLFLRVPLQPVATLTETADADPISGRTVTFSTTLGQTICSAQTDSSGTASCGGVLSLLPIVLSLGYDARFAGDDSYLPSSDRVRSSC